MPKVKRGLDLSQPLYHNCAWTPLLPLPELTRTQHLEVDGYILEGLVLPREVLGVPERYPVALPLPCRRTSRAPPRVVVVQVA